ncbi:MULTISPECIES: lytic transglycosylase domain-containing protein [unclassified Roseovarius]|uniref:lytic transglycosylase domain-containing protein n=1 Tax=unclassified Roseovarius TaxID=2614913 RepID=UPI00273EA4F0|nr:MULTISPECIES: lytic transglycosylase domain-containing protein [unclassified Roseovarius]
MGISRLASILAVLSLAGAAQAGDPPPYPDFTFKMSKPPKVGAGKRITVQIDPEEQQAILAAKPKPQKEPVEEAAPDSVGYYSWFWQKVSPDVAADASERFQKAVSSLSDGPGGTGVTGPRLQSIQSIAQAQGANILTATIGTKVSPALVLAIISVESGGRIDAVSGKGAQGLMQLMPDTAKRFGVTDSLSSAENIKGGVTYLDWLLGEFDGDAIMAIAGYNAGENAVKKHAGVPPYAETRDYVPKVLAAFEVAKGLCKTRPELVSDGCALTLAAN